VSCREAPRWGATAHSWPGHDTLQQITDLIDAGTLRATVTDEYPLARAAEALAKNRQGHARGKILLTISPID
jgi:NADPH:quinone reductase-like Zn-dependent oxidoreductase